MSATIAMFAVCSMGFLIKLYLFFRKIKLSLKKISMKFVSCFVVFLSNISHEK